MKRINTVDAVGHILCHDLTRIVKDEYKDARFRKGHTVKADDIPVLLAMGKDHLYVWEMQEGMLHENDAAERLFGITSNINMSRSEVKEGKIDLFAACSGLFIVDCEKLNAINSIDEIIIATRHSYSVVAKGDKLAGMRVVPLVIDEDKLRQAEHIAQGEPILQLLPLKLQKAGVITTGNEIYQGRIQDTFTPVIESKLRNYGIEVVKHLVVGDGIENILSALEQMRGADIELIICTGGMSVDPDDNTPGAIKQSGARIVSYGAPVLPGAMFLLGYYENNLPVLGLPGCVMYAKATIFDLLLPRIVAGVEIAKKDIVRFGNGGLCLACNPCHYPICPFGK